MLRITRKRLVVALTSIAVLGLTAAAFAYFTTTSSGTGSASVGTSDALTFSGAATVSNLYPGGSARPIQFSVTNDSNGHQYLGKMSASVTAVYDSTNTTEIDEKGTAACDTTNFSTATAASAVGDIAGGATYVSSTAGTAYEPTVSMNNDNGTGTAVNQNGCENAVVHLSLSSS